jgi:hypothetical protein
VTDKGKLETHELRDTLIGPLISGGIAVLTAYAFEFFITALWPKLRSVLVIWRLSLIGTIVVLLIGLGLFLFKKHYQKIYGLAEIGFALAVGWTSITRAQSSSGVGSWTAVLAAAYLVVRGLSNYDEGRKRELP